MTEQCDERKLIREVQSGSLEAFEQLLDLYEDRVFNLACRMVGKADAEDAAQDALIEIYKSIAGFRGRSSLSTWIYRVTANVCLQHRRRRRPEVSPMEPDLADCQADPGGDPVGIAVKSEVASQVDAAIWALGDTHRDVVVLHELQGLTYRECAAVLGCPVGTVKSRLFNAFGKLRELLREYASEGGLPT